jgi:hypothetical protein
MEPSAGRRRTDRNCDVVRGGVVGEAKALVTQTATTSQHARANIPIRCVIRNCRTFDRDPMRRSQSQCRPPRHEGKTRNETVVPLRTRYEQDLQRFSGADRASVLGTLQRLTAGLRMRQSTSVGRVSELSSRQDDRRPRSPGRKEHRGPERRCDQRRVHPLLGSEVCAQDEYLSSCRASLWFWTGDPIMSMLSPGRLSWRQDTPRQCPLWDCLGHVVEDGGLCLC